MILKIQNNRSFRLACVVLAMNIFAQLVVPSIAWGLTGGPTQPEFGSFTPISTTDMVDLSSGDMNYNIPLMDVGGYPLNIAYNSGIGTDDEASWVGLGWNLSVGQINRNVRGLPDDFAGDELVYENYLKPNITAGANFEVTPGLFGANLDLSFGMSAIYNNYTGFSVKPSVGISVDLGSAASIGFNVESGPDGLSVSPSLSISYQSEIKNNRNTKVGASVGTTWNSRSGVSQLTMGVSAHRQAYGDVNKPDEVYKYGVTNSKGHSIGSSISFADALYTPTKRVGMHTGSFTANLAVGGELWGVEVQGQVTGFGTITKMQDAELYKEVQAYGYNYSKNPGTFAVMDFNREKDGAISVNSTHLPLTNYTYDTYSVEGQGVGGMYRPYKNQVGYVYDPYVVDYSESGSLGVEIGAGNAVHLGIDFDVTTIEAHSGMWTENNQIVDKFAPTGFSNINYEPVHFKNVGDLSVDRDFNMFAQTGDYQAIRVNVVGSKFNRKAVSEYKKKTGGNSESYLSVGSAIKRTQRQARNQAIYNVSKAQLDAGVGYGPLVYETSPIVSSSAKDHHINEVQVIRNDGARYIYGQPSYNNIKKEATFAVSGGADCETGLVNYTHSSLSNPASLPNDKYFNRVTTPAYVNSHLISSVLSTDYVDRSGNGPSTDDFGSYTKFSYVRKDENYKWRVPYTSAATYNEGLKTETEDDQGSYVYGEKELLYVDKIETKTHVAIFSYSARKDGLGVLGEAGGKDVSEVTYKLDSISLYSIEEYNNGSPGTPIKVVHFEYSYSLCPGIPNNSGSTSLEDNEVSNKLGKLTLKKIYFTYRDSKMGKYTGYHFNYGEYRPIESGGVYYHPDEYTAGSPTLVLNSTYNPGGGLPAAMTGFNPEYNIKAYDTWGNYKPNGGGCANLDEINSAEFPYTEQDQGAQDVYSSAWSLRKIKLPSGGSISMSYESDDYATVQNKETKRMFKVQGVGDAANGMNGSSQYYVDLASGNELFSMIPNPDHINYVYVELDPDAQTSTNSGEIAQKYIGNSSEPIYFRFLMNMTMAGGDNTADNNAKFDYVTGYFQYDKTSNLQIFETNGKKYLSLPITQVDMEGGVFGAAGVQVNPISKAGWLFGRKYLNGHVYSLQPNGNSSDVLELVNQLVGPSTLNNLIEAFTGPNGALERKHIARRFIKGKAWVRLREPDQRKLGGGCRVKEIRMSDAWAEMTDGSNYQTMNYGQQYSYELTNGKTSGVATYEPVGNKENPFVQPVFSTTNHILAPDEENYVEMPFGESFFPNPQVTYARVSVSNVTAGQAPSGNPDYVVKKLHRTGHVVTEFYTSKDFPTITDQTRMDPMEDKQEALDNILSLNVRKHFTASQGYVVHLNDMNGKQKAQWVFAEGQNAPISGVEYIYATNSTPAGYSAASEPIANGGKLNNLVRVINPDGTIEQKTIGVEVDVVNDFRENATNSETMGLNTNLANFFVGVIPGIVPLPMPDYSRMKDQFRSVVTTKVINTFGILQETIAYDAGASVSTKNLAWDAETGEVLVTETVDEYSDKYYTFNYPAHWYYEGMAQASNNLGMTGTLTSASSGFYTINGISPYLAGDFLIEGDELYLPGSVDTIGWVREINGNAFKLIDSDGNSVTDAAAGSAKFEVIRSGHRNLQSAGIMNVTLMENPLKDGSGNYYTSLPTGFLQTTDWADWKIINAGAVDYSDRWKVGCECGVDVGSGSYNPYVVNERGVWRTKSSRTYLTGRNKQDTLTPRREGYFTSFSPMYTKSTGGAWYKSFANWTFVAEVSKYSPYGFELENRDALDRRSAAQYGYNNTFPMAVGANTRYREIGFDGFEDYGFDGCAVNAHFSFKDATYDGWSSSNAHTGKHSFKISAGDTAIMSKKLECETRENPEL